jgi:hypothetical protein
MKGRLTVTSWGSRAFSIIGGPCYNPCAGAYPVGKAVAYTAG